MTDRVSAPTLDDLDRLFGLMAKHGITQCVYRGVTVIRPLAEPTPSPAETRENGLARLSKLTDDKLDRELMLQRTGGGVG